jgi:hypothetical protein
MLDADAALQLLLKMAHRTMALPVGRGIFTLSTARSLLTEAIPIPMLVLSGPVLGSWESRRLLHCALPHCIAVLRPADLRLCERVVGGWCGTHSVE